MIGHPWISILVGAVIPRQKTAFASDERKTNPPVKQAMAVQINKKRRICLSLKRNFQQCYAKFASKTRQPARS